MTAASRKGVRTMPNDLISRSALLPAIESYFEPINPDHPMTLTIEQIREVLNLLPAVDAVEVVRCEDCKYFTDKGVCTFYSVFKNDGSYLLMQLMDDDDFCSYGERKESNEI